MDDFGAPNGQVQISANSQEAPPGGLSGDPPGSHPAKEHSRNTLGRLKKRKKKSFRGEA